MKKLAIITSHPIQYNAPLFKFLEERKIIHVKVFYTWGKEGLQNKYDPGFNKIISWDIPLLDGYEYEFLENTATDKGSHHFKGIINPDIIERIELYDPTAILVFGWAFVSHLKVLRHFKNKIPLYFRGDSTLLGKMNRYKAIARNIFLRWVYRHIDYALYVGENNKKYFLKYGLKEKQLVFAPHAIDNERFANPDDLYKAEAAQWKKELGIDPEDLVLIFCGKLEVQKNPFFLTALLRSYTDKRLKIIMVGNGILEKELKEFAEIDKRLILVDFQNQLKMPIVYRLADIFILPSFGETWGLTVNEAMVAASCVIMLTEKAGAAVDLVKDGENGITFGINDVKKCVSFIETLIDDREKLGRMKKASESIIKNYSFAKIADAIEQLVLQS